MNKIYKYVIPLEPDYDIRIGLPVGAELLTAQIQKGKIAMWARVNVLLRGMEIRTFNVLFTGDSVPKDAIYIDTMQNTDGLVYHLFEVLL